MQKRVSPPKTFESRGIRIVYDPDRKLAKVWCRRPNAASRNLEKLTLDRRIDRPDTIILYDPDNLNVARLIRGVDVHTFLHTREEPAKPPKKTLAELAQEQS